MRVKVLKTFHDKDNFAKVYAAGDVAEFDASRFAVLQSLGLVEGVRPHEERPIIKKKGVKNDD